jgi:hypothetical protein
MLIFQALANSRFFRPDCGVNISRRRHVLQTDLFLKIYSSIWLSQNFLGYNYSAAALAFGTVLYSSSLLQANSRKEAERVKLKGRAFAQAVNF